MRKFANNMVLYCVILFAGQAISSEHEWKLVKTDSENNLKIYYKALPNGNVEFKGITYIESSMNSIVGLFMDFNSMPLWVYRTKTVEKLDQLSPTEIFIYAVHTMPIPFRDRDAVNFIRLWQDAESKVVTITISGRPDYIQENEDLVRVPVSEAKWQLSPMDEDIIEIVYSGFGEPGGSISSEAFRSGLFQWLIKAFLWEVPYQTLLALRVSIHQEKYQKASFPFITEYYD